jgi:DNA-binding CsgD family transcriptional regulator
MTLDPREILTSAIGDLDSVRVQLKEALAQKRYSRFYDLLRIKRVIGEDHAETIGLVIELLDGYCIVYWLKSVGITVYPSNISMRTGLKVGETTLLSLVEVSECIPSIETRRSGPVFLLNNTERRALTLIGQGLSNSQIGFKLKIPTPTIKNNLTRAYRKLGVRSRTEAALIVRDLDLTLDEPLEQK